MQAAQITATRRLSLSWLGLLPTAVVVALSMQACTADVPNATTTGISPTDPSCRPVTCSTLGKNCGILNDGCGGTLRCGTCSGAGNDCRDNVCERGCQTNTECPAGGSCINGSCTDKCADSRDCPSGQYCNAGTCAANAATSCRYDSECRADERCANNSCQGLNSGTNRTCRSDSECRGGESCNSGMCSNVGGRACRYQSDCNTGNTGYGNQATCTNGYCSTQGGNSCSTDSNCSYGERCSYGVCRRTDGNNGAVVAECYTRSVGIGIGIGIDFGFGGISFGNSNQENWLYEQNSSNANGVRVDSCTCPPGEYKMHIQDQWGSRDISCSRCVKNGDERTCYR